MIPKVHLPCPDCNSSDALTDYGTHTHCFSCNKHTLRESSSNNNYNNSLIITNNNNNKINNMIQIEPNNSWRGISKDTFRFYDCKFQVDDTGKFTQVDFNYPNGSCKHRLVDTKTFYTTGPMTDSDLYGYNKFSPGSSKAITITEGEIDCLSAFQMLGSKYPVITFKASACAGKDCAKQFKYIDSFDRIYLCLDNDDVGRRTAQAIASLFDPNKIYVCQFAEGMKDANDYLTQGKSEEFVKLWWGSKRYLPKGIINGYDEIKEVLGRTAASSLATYPFPTLNEMTYGIREGEVNLFTAMEKVGKTEVMRAIEHHLLKTTEHNIGIIHLEEDEKRSVQGLLSYELDTPVHLPDSIVSVDDQLKAYKDLVKREGRLNFYTHFGSDDPDTILGVLRYMVSSLGCKFIFLDHITMLVTGYEGDDERRKLDYISTRLAMLTRELKFTLFLVSHVNDDGKTRGSRNISKVADLIVHLDRNPEADSIDGRNTTSLLVKGNRFAARSGPAGYLWFDPSKYQVKEKTIDEVLVNDMADKF